MTSYCAWLNSQKIQNIQICMSGALQISSGDPEEPEIRPILSNMCFFKRSLGLIPIVGNSIEKYIKWCSPNAKRMQFGSRYEHVMIFGFYDIVML